MLRINVCSPPAKQQKLQKSSTPCDESKPGTLNEYITVPLRVGWALFLRLDREVEVLSFFFCEAACVTVCRCCFQQPPILSLCPPRTPRKASGCYMVLTHVREYTVYRYRLLVVVLLSSPHRACCPPPLHCSHPSHQPPSIGMHAPCHSSAGRRVCRAGGEQHRSPRLCRGFLHPRARRRA